MPRRVQVVGVFGDACASVNVEMNHLNIIHNTHFNEVFGFFATCGGDSITSQDTIIRFMLLNPICGSIAEFLDLRFVPTRNVIAGINLVVPYELKVVEELLLCQLWEQCSNNGIDYPSELTVFARRVATEALYFWTAFFRNSRQNFRFLSNGHAIWREAMLPRMQ